MSIIVIIFRILQLVLHVNLAKKGLVIRSENWRFIIIVNIHHRNVNLVFSWHCFEDDDIECAKTCDTVLDE